MRRTLLSLALTVTGALGATAGWTPTATAADTGNPAPQTGRIVSEAPAAHTPHILDGTVYSIAQVGDLIVVGGTFTQVRNANTSAILTRNHLLAFSATTGRVSASFVPEPNGSQVRKVLPAHDGRSVYVAGAGITSVAGAKVRNVFELDTTAGDLVTRFSPAQPNAAVNDLELVGNRLFLAGRFVTLGGTPQVALGVLNATSGGLSPYFTGDLAGTHNDNAGAVTAVGAIATSPAGNQLVAVGNFTSVNGASRPQIAKLDLGPSGSSLSPWSTTLYTSACAKAFDSPMTDVAYATDGSYYIVSTTGAYGGTVATTSGTSGCDGVARFESASTTASSPSWTAYTGGDTTWSVEVTDDVVYVGGHMRWENNPTKSNRIGQGAVTRTGIAALDPVNGMPYSWNPTRTRGVGVQDMLATEDGLYVGSDTAKVGGETHQRVALLPLEGGKQLPRPVAATLPASVYSVASGGSTLQRRTFTGASVTASAAGPTGVDWSRTVGAFQVDGVLYTATSDGQLTRRTVDGTTYGTPSPVDAADLLAPQTDWHGGDVPYLTSLFYSQGRIYFTKSTSSAMYSRGFEVESDIVGQLRAGVTGPSGVSGYLVRGAFVAGGRLYYSTTNGSLYSTAWSTTGASGTPVLVSGPTKDGQSWASRAMFLG